MKQKYKKQFETAIKEGNLRIGQTYPVLTDQQIKKLAFHANGHMFSILTNHTTLQSKNTLKLKNWKGTEEATVTINSENKTFKPFKKTRGKKCPFAQMHIKATKYNDKQKIIREIDESIQESKNYEALIPYIQTGDDEGLINALAEASVIIHNMVKNKKKGPESVCFIYKNSYDNIYHQ